MHSRKCCPRRRRGPIPAHTQRNGNRHGTAIFSPGEMLTLPFRHPAPPAPLPSDSEIENPDEVLGSKIGSTVVRVGTQFVVKYGYTIDPIEAETMIFVKHATSIRVSEVYAVYRSESNSMVYIVMEYITGSTLLEQWGHLTQPEKTTIMADLRGQVDVLRQLPSPGYFGGVGGQHMPNGIFWCGGDEDEDESSITGPFKTEAELNEAFALKSIQIAKYNERENHRGHFYRRMLPRILKDHPPVFTHGDLQRKNIVVRKRRPDLTLSTGSPAGDYEVILVDWEQTGWYPSYWEYCAASWAFWFDDDWPEMVEHFLEPYPVEYAWLSVIGNELWS